MRKGLIAVLVTAAGFSSGTVDGAEAVQCPLSAMPTCAFPNLVSTIGADVSPQSLPASEYSPVGWDVFGKIATRDGTHPSALREVHLDIDKDVRVNSRDYPACKMGGRKIEALTTRAAERFCGAALVGRGKAVIELAFPPL